MSAAKCPNCGEHTEYTAPCACFRNRCTDCGGPVGNVTFTLCDACWVNRKALARSGRQEETLDKYKQARCVVYARLERGGK